MLPELRGTNSEIGVYVGLVPENAVLQLRRLARVVNHEALVILRALVHNLAEKLERGKGRGVVVENTFPIIEVRLTEDEHEVHVGTERRLNTERVLHSNQEEGLQPPPIHEKIANILVVSPTVIVHTVVQNHE